MDFLKFFKKKTSIPTQEPLKDKFIDKPVEFNESCAQYEEEKSIPKKKSQPKIKNTKEKKKHYEGHRQRLKDKFLSNSIEQVMDYEILECLLMYSIPRNDVKPLAKELLAQFKSLRNICFSSTEQLSLIPGIGPNTLCFFKVLGEVYCRFEKEAIIEEITLNSPDKVATYCQARMGFLKYEQFRVLFLNKKNRLIKDLILQNGTIDRAAIFPRELVLQALHLGAGGMILVHNHPSGDPTPSKADIDITKEIKNAANLMDILIYDHLILSKNAFYSMKAHKVF